MWETVDPAAHEMTRNDTKVHEMTRNDMKVHGCTGGDRVAPSASVTFLLCRGDTRVAPACFPDHTLCSRSTDPKTEPLVCKGPGQLFLYPYPNNVRGRSVSPEKTAINLWRPN